MNYWYLQMYQEARTRELMREAEIERLIREAGLRQVHYNSIYKSLSSWLGINLSSFVNRLRKSGDTVPGISPAYRHGVYINLPDFHDHQHSTDDEAVCVEC